MRITHPEIVNRERFGNGRRERADICCFCQREIGRDCETKIIDLFGRVFCGKKCENKYYGIKREDLV